MISDLLIFSLFCQWIPFYLYLLLCLGPDIPNDSESGSANVVKCFVPVIPPLLTTVIETDVGVLTTAAPLPSPHPAQPG